MDSQSIPSIRKNSSKLSRDQRLQVLTLYKVGKSRKEISDALRITIHQVKYTNRKGFFDPGISPEQEYELERFVCSSKKTRLMTYLDLAMKLPEWNVGEDAVRNALKRRGYSRRIARSKPPLSDEHRRLRLEWAERHQSFSLNDWYHIIWSDMTWINDSPVNNVHVTRKEHVVSLSEKREVIY